jgi:hypothetical protein
VRYCPQCGSKLRRAPPKGAPSPATTAPSATGVRAVSEPVSGEWPTADAVAQQNEPVTDGEGLPNRRRDLV